MARLPIGDRGDHFGAEILPLEDSLFCQGERHAERQALPRGGEAETAIDPRGGVRLPRHHTQREMLEARLHHPAPQAPGGETTATPIMASGVTKAASSSSLSPSVPV